MDTNLICKSCQNPVSETYYFCPYCGKKRKEPPLSTSAGKQMGLYFMAVFFPYFAFLPGIRYVRQPGEKAKAVGVIVLLTAGISLMSEVYFMYVFYNQFGQILINSLSVDYGSLY